MGEPEQQSILSKNVLAKVAGTNYGGGRNCIRNSGEGI